MAIARKPAAKPAPAPAKKVAEVAATPAAMEAAAAKVETVLRESAEKTIAGAREAQETFRKSVEQSVAQSRAAYDKLRVAAEEATGTLETSYAAATKGVNAINAKALDAIKAQSEATLEHMKAVMASKNLGEAIALQTAHARKQFEAFSAQAKDMAELAQKFASEAAEPLKATLTKTFAR